MTQSSEREISNFKDRVFGILSEALRYYTSGAGQYNPEVQSKHQLELKNKIKEQLYPSFTKQVGMIKNNTFESFRAKITELEVQPLEQIVPKLEQTLKSFYINHIGIFQTHIIHATALLFEG